MNNSFIKKQMLRIIFNYIRMIMSFSIGIIIIKHLLLIDNDLYSTYILVVIGLGIGVMLREVLRATLVPFLSINNNKDFIDTTQFNKSLFISLLFISSYILIVILILQFSDSFSVSEKYKASLNLFIILRAIGSAVLLLAIPALNVFAFKGKMGIYNLFMLFERIGELVAIEAVLYQVFTSDPSLSLQVIGAIYICWNFFLVLFLYLKLKNSREISHLKFVPITKTDFLYLKHQISGNIILVFNMALYFRFSLLLINMLFGELISSMYGLIIQLLGYLRQAVMGLVTGIDSVFSKKLANKTPEHEAHLLFTLSNVNSIILTSGSVILYFLLPHLIAFTISGELESHQNEIFHLSILFMIGIIFRSLSETWMQYLTGKGQVLSYSKKIFIVASSTPIAILLVAKLGISPPLFWISLHFLIAMYISHIVIIPSVIKQIFGFSLFTIQIINLTRFIIYGVGIAAYQLNKDYLYEVIIFYFIVLLIDSSAFFLEIKRDLK